MTVSHFNKSWPQKTWKKNPSRISLPKSSAPLSAKPDLALTAPVPAHSKLLIVLTISSSRIFFRPPEKLRLLHQNSFGPRTSCCRPPLLSLTQSAIVYPPICANGGSFF